MMPESRGPTGNIKKKNETEKKKLENRGEKENVYPQYFFLHLCSYILFIFTVFPACGIRTRNFPFFSVGRSTR